MKSVGEVMAIGRTFKEALGKGIRSLETGKFGSDVSKNLIPQKLITPTPDRLSYIRFAFAKRLHGEEIHEMTAIDPWFLSNCEENDSSEAPQHWLARRFPRAASARQALRHLRSQIAKSWNVDRIAVRNRRKELGVPPSSAASTPARPNSKASPRISIRATKLLRSRPTDRKKVMILGSGPNRIGQGIEFDYCCCHARSRCRKMGVESIMVNCNPETVSTDYDTSDRLYFEPLTLENVLNIVDTEKPDGVIVQFGGQTPLNLALPLKRLGVPIIGTDPEYRPRRRPQALRQAARRSEHSVARRTAPRPAWTRPAPWRARIGYPVLVRPSYVLGGRAMVIAYDEDMRAPYMREAVTFSQDRPVLVDRFLEDATEVDVDALCDGDDVLIAGIMEHIEEAGVHSGDSSCVLPPQSRSRIRNLAPSKTTPCKLAKALNVIGLMNVQYAIKERHGLRARSEPARLAHRALRQQGDRRAAAQNRGRADAGAEAEGLRRAHRRHRRGAAGAAGSSSNRRCFPFNKFPGVDPALGPEMRSTGEVMGVGVNFGEAFLEGADQRRQPLPEKGTPSSSASTTIQKQEAVGVAKRFAESRLPTGGHARHRSALRSRRLVQDRVFKVNEGRPNVVDLLKGGSHPAGDLHHHRRPAFHDEKPSAAAPSPIASPASPP
jgi:carbamoyl-phosphate synthase large subunit